MPNDTTRILSTNIGNSKFVRYVLSDEETKIGSQLTSLQKQCIQNQICEVAEKKLELEYNEEHKHQFISLDAFYRGQIESLQYLITLSESFEDLDYVDLNNPEN